MWGESLIQYLHTQQTPWNVNATFKQRRAIQHSPTGQHLSSDWLGPVIQSHGTETKADTHCICGALYKGGRDRWAIASRITDGHLASQRDSVPQSFNTLLLWSVSIHSLDIPRSLLIWPAPPSLHVYCHPSRVAVFYTPSRPAPRLINDSSQTQDTLNNLSSISMHHWRKVLT